MLKVELAGDVRIYSQAKMAHFKKNSVPVAKDCWLEASCGASLTMLKLKILLL
jgi:hypothetical protein